MKACEELGLVTIHYKNILTLANADEATKLTNDAVLDRYSDNFSEQLGCIARIVNLVVDDEIPPVKQTARKLPLALREDV